MVELRKDGASLQAIANELNKEGHITRRSKPWHQMQVSRIIDRMEATSADKSPSRSVD
jgi:hypothetical protein